MMMASAVMIPASLVLDAPWRLDPTGTSLLSALWLGLVPAYLFLQVGDGSVAQLAYACVFLFFIMGAFSILQFVLGREDDR